MEVLLVSFVCVYCSCFGFFQLG